MLTPQEVSEKVFPKSSGFGNGYAMAQVDEFLDTLTEDYTALYKENVTLKAKLKILAEKVEEYRATEDAMRSTLLTAQKMATQLVQEAETKKQQILSEAADEAAAKVSHIQAATRDAQQRLQIAKESLGDFIRQSLEIVEGQASFLRTLPEMDLTAKTQEVPAAPAAADAAPAVPEEKPVGEDTAVFEIEKSVLQHYQKESAAPAPEQPAPEQPASEQPAETETAGETDPFAESFKLELNDLKFGRNYDTKSLKK